MDRRTFARAALALVLGLGLSEGFARADSPRFPKTPPAATELPPGYPPVDSSPVKHPLWRWLRDKLPLGCWASFNGLGCSSLHSEAAFVFGSCRTFFGEPCLKGAPPSALPPYAGAESGYYPGQQPGARNWFTDGGPAYKKRGGLFGGRQTGGNCNCP